MSTHPGPSAASVRDVADAGTPQFFISLVNTGREPFLLQHCHTSSACGWVQEPIPGECILPGGERVWCGMPWDMGETITLDLVLHTPSGAAIAIHFSRRHPAPAEASLELSQGLQGQAELQRASSSSPFFMVTVGA